MKIKLAVALIATMFLVGMGLGGYGALATFPMTAPYLQHTSFGQQIVSGLEKDFGGSNNNNGGNNGGNNCNNCNNGNQTCQNCNSNQTQTMTNSTTGGGNNNNPCLGQGNTTINGPMSVNGSPNSCSLSGNQQQQSPLIFGYSGSMSITVAASQSVKVTTSGAFSMSKTGTSITISGSFSSGQTLTITLTNSESSNTTYSLSGSFS